MCTKIIKFIIVIFLCLNISLTYAAKSKAWKNETDTFRGIKIGSNILEEYKECPHKINSYSGAKEYIESWKNGYPSEFKGVPCYKLVHKNETSLYSPQLIEESELFDIDNLLFIKGAGSEARVISIKNHVVSIEILFTSLHREEIFSSMIDKYGDPSSLKVNEYKNGYGQSFYGRLAQWNGRQVTLTYRDYTAGKIDFGSIEMHSEEYSEKLFVDFQKDKENIKKGF